MSHINGGTILLTMFLIALIGISYSIRGAWQQIFHRDISPLQQAKKKWCKARAGTIEETLAANEWDDLGKKEILEAKDFSALYNARERSLAYTSFWGVLKRRESPTIDAYYEERYNEIKKKKKAEADRAKQTHIPTDQENRHAPHLKKIPGAGKNITFSSRH